MTFNEYLKELKKLKKDMPELMSMLLLQEGEFAVKQAKLDATKEPDTVNTGFYRESFHCGKVGTIDGKKRVRKAHDGAKVRKFGKKYKIDVYNSSDYAQHLEYGFRSHFVPGEWKGKTFVYDRNAKTGMYVGKPGDYVRGKFHLKHGIDAAKKTQAPRLARKLNAILRKRGLQV